VAGAQGWARLFLPDLVRLSRGVTEAWVVDWNHPLTPVLISYHERSLLNHNRPHPVQLTHTMATSGITSAPVETIKNAVSSAVSAVSNAVAPGTAEPTAGDEGAKDESSVMSPGSPETRKAMERKLSLRPERNELVEKNILKNTSVAPSLQAAQAELERAQLEDQLESKLQRRPTVDELVKEGILNADEIPGTK